MKATARAVNLIKQFESCALKAYKCPAGVLTIGWGNTSHAKAGMTCTQAQAYAWLNEDISKTEDIVTDALDGTPVSQNQFDALVSFVFNIGGGNFRKSTLLKKIKAGDSAGAAAEFGRWVYAGKKILPGLVMRRATEKALFEGRKFEDKA